MPSASLVLFLCTVVGPSDRFVDNGIVNILNALVSLSLMIYLGDQLSHGELTPHERALSRVALCMASIPFLAVLFALLPYVGIVTPLHRF